MYLDKELKKMVKVQENAYDPEVFFKTVDGVLKSMEELKPVYKILDYGLCSMRGIMLTKEQLEDWELRAYPNIGGSEGIYMDVLLCNHQNGSRLRLACYKTLEEDLSATMAMGTLAGAWTHVGALYQFINAE